MIPAFAEARHLATTLAAVHRFLVTRDRLADTELVIVTADASDGTPDIARRELARFPIHQHVLPGPKLGKGRDVRAGMLVARGETVLFMDADLATPLHHVDAALASIDAGADIVIGCRDLEHVHHVWSKSLASRLGNVLTRNLLLPDLHDTQCGFKAFRREVVHTLFEPLRTSGWGFDFEVLARARQHGLTIVELPIADWHDPKCDRGLAGDAPWRACLRTLGELLDVIACVGRQSQRG